MMIHSSGSTAGSGKSRGSGFGSESTRTGSSGAGWGNSSYKPAPDPMKKQTVRAVERVNYPVLVFDSNRSVAETKAGLLRAHAYSADKAATIEEAVEIADCINARAIVVDADTLGYTSRFEDRGGDMREIGKTLGRLRAAAPDAKILVMDVEFGRGREASLKGAGADMVIDTAAIGRIAEAVDGLMPVRFAPFKHTNGRTVLVALEDKFVAGTYGYILVENGYECIASKDFTTAVGNAIKADLVIMDQGRYGEGLVALMEMLEDDPDVKVIMRPHATADPGSSGYAGAVAVLPVLSINEAETLKTLLATHLPLKNPPKQEAPAAGAPVEEAPKAAKTHLSVLIVDDDESVSGVGFAMLEREGHAVTTMRNGAKGLEAYKKALDAGTPFGLVVSDIKMPEMNGPAMVREIRKLNPAARIIFMTGYCNDDEMKQLKEAAPEAIILTKPFSKAALDAAVEKTLSA